jgi:predicted PurR-regulated permease PerM
MDPARDDPRRLPPARRPLAGADLWAWTGGLLLLALAWRLASVLLLLFAAALVALALRCLCTPLEHRLGWPRRAALAAVVLGLAVVLSGSFWLLGAGAADELQALRETLPVALRALQDWLRQFAWGRWLIEAVAAVSAKPEDWQQMAGIATGTLQATLGIVGAFVLVLVLGVYLAADAASYRRGLLRMVPPARRALAMRVLDGAADKLARWLVGQSLTMLAVGLLTAAGLSLIGMPLVFSLSVIAALLEIVPYFGPLATGVLVVALALTRGEEMALWAGLVCLAVQQTEAYVFQPMAQRWAVRLPPVLALLSVLVFGALFGVPGVLLAMPLMVLAMALVEQLVLAPGRQ